MTTLPSSHKPLDLPPTDGHVSKQQYPSFATPVSVILHQLDDDAKAYYWKLIHTWLRYEKLQTRWASVINDILLLILQTRISETTSSNSGVVPLYMCIQLFETGSPSQSKYLQGVTHGTQLQLLTDLPLPAVYGGTVRFYGVSQSLQQTLIDIMALSLYSLYSLQLEVDVMHDHLITLSTQLSQYQVTRKHDSETSNDLDNGTSWKFGLIGWLFGKSNYKAGDEKTQHSEKYSTPTGINTTLKRRLSTMVFKNLSKKSTDDDNTDNKNIGSTKKSPSHRNLSDPHYYKSLKLGLEHACISTSPSCTFVTPPIVDVLEREEDNMNTMKMIISKGQQQQKLTKNTNQRFSDQLLRNKLTSLARRSSSILSLGPTTTTQEPNTTILPQYIMAYSLLRIPREILNDTNKIGLDHLYLDTASTDAFTYHQHIVIDYTSYPIGCPDRPCLGPSLCTIQYFRFDHQSPCSDQTLGRMIEHWLDECNTPCKNRIDQHTATSNNYSINTQPSPKSIDQQHTKTENKISSASNFTGSAGTSSSTTQKEQQRPNNTKMLQHGCKQPLQDHVLCFGHGSSRINVYFVTTTSAMNDDHTTMEGDILQCWLSCTICDAKTRPRRISQGTYQFSFGKYLELCLYSTRFNELREDLCQHAKTTPTAIARCFGTAPKNNNNSTEIRFVKEEIKVYRLMGSPLQVVQPPPLSTSSPTLTPRISHSTMEKWIIREQRSVDDLFKSMRQHISYLNDHQLNGKTDTDIWNWHNTLDTDHEHLLTALKDLSNDKDGDCCLNDFRRLFSLKSCSVVDDLNTWQRKRWSSEQGQHMDLFTWKARPDYMNTVINQTIHCFPDSAIMVRELEPTSIIAYTLSSNDYVEELAQVRSFMTNADNDIPTKTATSPRKMTSPTSSPKINNDGSDNNGNGNTSSDDGNQDEIIDGYYSTVERKYIAFATGSASETASFRTMVLETVRNNVNEQHHLSQMKKYLTRKSPFLLTSDKIQQQQQTERDLDISCQQSTKDIKESTVYHNPPPSNSPGWFSDDDDNSINFGTTNPATGQSSSMLNDSSNLLSPHIKHRFVHADKEFTCVVYYANEFELLRKSCGVEQLVIESLGRCQQWGATGGKSKSQFYKTQDDRLVVKEMVNAWNIAEKDTFLRFAPKYFDYIKESDSAPTILTKIFGFYSVQIKSLNEKKELLNMDLLVMEQLFYGQFIDKTFDFKGIPDRQVDEDYRSQQQATLWDGDWLDSYRMGYVTNEQSNEWIKSAIQRDTEFLAKGNIMDYSLLVGVNKEKKELTVGIVDFIGAYTWYKKIESRSKSTIHRNREVTVLPPDQYRLRFCREVLNYFIPIPGKFDKILPEQTYPTIWMK